MEGVSGPQEAGAWRFRFMCVAAAVAVVVFGILLHSDLTPPQRRVIGGAGIIASGLSLGASCAYRFWRSTGRRRRAWLFFGGACVVAAIGNANLIVAPAVGGPTATSSPADISLLIALLLGVAGVITFPSARRRRTDVTRMILDGVVLGGSILVIASVTVFPQILDVNSGNIGARAVSLLVPVVDVVIATVAALLFMRGTGSDRPTLALASAGFGLYAVSDFGSAALTSRATFTYGTIVDLGWIAGYLMITLGVNYSARTSNRVAPGEISPIVSTSVLFALVIVAAALSSSEFRDNRLSAASAALWLVVLLGVAGRQILLILDNETLRRGLEQRVAERSSELRQVTQRTDLMVNSVGDGIYGVDQDGRITFVNPAAARALGYTVEALVGQDAHAMFHAAQDNGRPFPVTSCYITEAIRDGRATNAEDDVYLRADGRLVPVEVTASPLTGDEDVQGAVVVFRDVTQRREVDRLKNEFVSMVSHELRTPLTSIRGSLGLLAGGAFGALAAPAKRMIEIALDSTDRLSRLINQILDIERVESGTIPMEVHTHTAAELIRAATQQVQVIAVQAQVQVSVERTAGDVSADADRVIQTLLNLLGNAIKFSPPHTVVTVASAVRGSAVEFRITDHGRGIPEDKLDAIFARFEQVDSSDAREKGGSGLGLAISRSIVERLGGTIWAENNEGAGATFRFTLPRAPEPERDLPPGPEHASDPKPTDGVRRNGHRTPLAGHESLPSGVGEDGRENDPADVVR